MSVFPSEPQATRVTFSKSTFSVHLVDGRVLEVPLAYFPRLLHAKPKQRHAYELSGDGAGIHWDDLDEDISVEGLLLGVGDRIRRSVEPSRGRKTAQERHLFNGQDQTIQYSHRLPKPIARDWLFLSRAS